MLRVNGARLLRLKTNSISFPVCLLPAEVERVLKISSVFGLRICAIEISETINFKKASIVYLTDSKVYHKPMQNRPYTTENEVLI
jgi:hypothetical protein